MDILSEAECFFSHVFLSPDCPPTCSPPIDTSFCLNFYLFCSRLVCVQSPLHPARLSPLFHLGEYTMSCLFALSLFIAKVRRGFLVLVFLACVCNSANLLSPARSLDTYADRALVFGYCRPLIAVALTSLPFSDLTAVCFGLFQDGHHCLSCGSLFFLLLSVPSFFLFSSIVSAFLRFLSMECMLRLTALPHRLH